MTDEEEEGEEPTARLATNHRLFTLAPKPVPRSPKGEPPPPPPPRLPHQQNKGRVYWTDKHRRTRSPRQTKTPRRDARITVWKLSAQNKPRASLPAQIQNPGRNRTEPNRTCSRVGSDLLTCSSFLFTNNQKFLKGQYSASSHPVTMATPAAISASLRETDFLI